MSVRTTFSQQTTSSIDDAERRAKLVAALERAQGEVKAGRALIVGLKEQIVAKQERIKALDDRDVQRVNVEKSLQNEVSDLKAAIDSQKKELKIKEDEVNYLKKELTKANKKLEAAHRQVKVLGATVLALITFVLLTR